MVNVNYDFKKIEKKWQDKWEKSKIFQVKESKKKKFYVLDMFPYPSGEGLHMGHGFVFSLGDIFARFKRMQGFNVLYPIGYDSLGLPAENAAIKVKTPPEEYTKKSISNFEKQQKAMGWSYDWSRVLKTSDPEYYRWDQWIFLKMLKKGIAYRKRAPVNWCPKCNTVLANEQVVNGKCWRHESTDVETKHLEQWFLKTTAYAGELLRGLEKIDWPERAKLMQRNWIGKSEGTEIDFEVETSAGISNVVIVHGVNDNEEEAKELPLENERHWQPWIKESLECRGIKISNELYPKDWSPDYNKWKKVFEKNKIDENSVLVGYSAGCAFLVRWLGETKKKVKKLILVAPWKIPSEEFSDGENEMYDYKIEKCVKKNVKERVIFTADDEEEDGKKSVKIFYNSFGGKIIELKGRKHFLEQ